MFSCTECNKKFNSQVGLNGHKRVHGPSLGKIKKIFCSCIFTRKVTPYQDLEKYQSTLARCKQCNSWLKVTTDRKTFCSQSCAATFNNKKYPKRKAQVRPEKVRRDKSGKLRIVKVKKDKIVLTEKEIKARKVEAVQAYRARKYRATPADADRKLIVEIYKNCPEGYEVDHIIALAEAGLHHQDNLQYLPAIVNRKKNRRQNYDRSTIIRWQDVVYYVPK